MGLEALIAAAMLLALTLYALSGGADFGGGVWDLLAYGPRADAQKRLIQGAIAPIWEANHVWLILVVVLLFTAFPTAFEAITTSLHVPLSLMLLGIVMRGAAFIFRTFTPDGLPHRHWSRVFASASVVTPVMLGMTIGALSSRAVWLAPFPFSIGIFTLALLAFLAATYLAVEAESPELKDDFRVRALIGAVVSGICAWICLAMAKAGAPRLYEGLREKGWSPAFQVLVGVVAVGAIIALWKRRYHWARALAATQVTLILWGWGLSQYPYIIAPDITFSHAAAPASVLRPLLGVLLLGLIVISPAFIFLYTVFKRGVGSTIRMKHSPIRSP